MLTVDVFFICMGSAAWIGFNLGLTQELLWIVTGIPAFGIFAGVWMHNVTYIPRMTPGERVRDS